MSVILYSILLEAETISVFLFMEYYCSGKGKKVKAAAAEHVNELLQSKLKILHSSTTLYNRGSKNVNSYDKKA